MTINELCFVIIIFLTVVSMILNIIKSKNKKSTINDEKSIIKDEKSASKKRDKKPIVIDRILFAFSGLIAIFSSVSLIDSTPAICTDSNYISDFEYLKKLKIENSFFHGEIYYTDDLSDPQNSDTRHPYNSEEDIIISEYELPKVINAKIRIIGPFWSKLGQLYVLPSNPRGGGKLGDNENNEFIEDHLENSYVSNETTIDFQDLPEGLIAGWGDNGGGRESYTLDEINSGVLGDKIIFNTIHDSVIGDEKNFVGARIADGTNKGASNVWNSNLITAEEGKAYHIRLYCHNNSPAGEYATAENVEARFIVPEESGKTVVVNGMFRCTNASPSEYWDSVVFTSDRSFHLEYVTGSAILENNGIGSNGGCALDDRITKDWVKLGYDELDGNIPGCYQYSSYTAIIVKPVFD